MKGIGFKNAGKLLAVCLSVALTVGIFTGFSLTAYAEPSKIGKAQALVDVTFDKDGIVDGMNGEHGEITGHASEYVFDETLGRYVAVFKNETHMQEGVEVADTDNYLVVPVPASVTEASPFYFTWEVLIKTSSKVDDGIFSGTDGAGFGIYGPWGEGAENQFDVLIHDGASYQHLRYPDVDADTWYHIVVVMDDTDVALYVNGQKADSIELANPMSITVNSFSREHIAIGADIANGLEDGVIYDPGSINHDLSVAIARIYDDAVSESDIANMYKAATSAPSDATDEPTAPPTEEPTEEPTEAPENTLAPTDAEAASTDKPAQTPAGEKKGCGSIIGGGAAVISFMAASAFILLKKKD